MAISELKFTTYKPNACDFDSHGSHDVLYVGALRILSARMLRALCRLYSVCITWSKYANLYVYYKRDLHDVVTVLSLGLAKNVWYTKDLR